MLAGIKVIELGTTITAPFAAMMLADLGADVIKVERPDGDPFRSFRGGSYSSHFAAYNRNKRSVVVDLQTDLGRDQLQELLGDADVFIDNLRSSALSRLGIDPAVVRERYPRLIHCSITGFGSIGPYRDRPAFDAVAQALSGLSSLYFDPDDPEIAGPTISDNVTGMYAAFGVVAALVERGRTGIGCRLEVNMLEASMAFIADAFAGVTQYGLEPGRFARAASSQSYALRCSDGRMIAVHLSSLDKFWSGLLAAVDATDLASDPRFANRMKRLENYAVLKELLAERFATQPVSVWCERLERADVPYAPVALVAEALADPQVAALGSVFTVEHPTQGTVTQLHSPLHVDGMRITAERPPPTLGEHTQEILLHKDTQV